MIIKNYLHYSTGYMNHRFSDVDFDLNLPGIIKPPLLPTLPDQLPIFTLPYSPTIRTWPELSETIKPSPLILPDHLEYQRNWEFDPIENNVTGIIPNPIHTWLEGATIKDILNFVFEYGQDVYEAITDILDGLKEMEKESASISLNQIFHNTSASDNFNGGFGMDTVVYSGNHDDYIIYGTEDILGKNTGYKVIEKNGNTTDTLIDIEQLEFADGTSQLGIIGSSEIFYPSA